MAESSSTIGSSNEIKPYRFEPVHATGHSDSENDSSESETETENRQALLSAWG